MNVCARIDSSAAARYGSPLKTGMPIVIGGAAVMAVCALGSLMSSVLTTLIDSGIEGAARSPRSFLAVRPVSLPS